jgi:hypothetical protein
VVTGVCLWNVWLNVSSMKVGLEFDFLSHIGNYGVYLHLFYHFFFKIVI